MSIRVITGDCRKVLAGMAAGSVHCCVTSPPYFGLRDYGTASWSGGDDVCKHSSVRRGHSEDEKQASSAGTSRDPIRGGDCRVCGATRIDSQIGLESTPDAYVAELVAVFREVRRVLRDDGTLWCNLGDSYASGNRATYQSGTSDNKGQTVQNDQPRPRDPPGIKPKDLLGIPWRVAFALQADGWYLRSDIIWSKPNPMPESVTDRPTKAHEYLFLLSKSATYYYDAAAIAESAVGLNKHDLTGPGYSAAGRTRAKGNRKTFRGGGVYTQGRSFDNDTEPCNDSVGNEQNETGLRNKRSVWTVAAQPFREAHFATFPPALIEPCILAGCPVGGTVLDLFGGAGTTGLVADGLQRSAILIELNPAYAAMAWARIEGDSPLFAEIAA